VLIGGVAVKELVLDKALQGAELGKITAQYPATVHESEGAPDLSFLFQDRPEGVAILPVVVEGLVDLVPVGLDEFAQGRGGAEMMFLAMEKKTQESPGIFFEDPVMLGGESALLGNETVKFPDPGFSAEGYPGGKAEGAQDRCFNLSDFKDAGGVLVDVPRVQIVIPHEGFNASQFGPVPILEGLGDNSLEPQGQNVGGLPGMIVHAVADPMEEVETLAQFVAGVGSEGASRMQFLKVTGAEERVGNPEQVVEVAHAAGAFLQIRFLQEDRGRELKVALFDIGAAFLKESDPVPQDAVLTEAASELFVEGLVSAKLTVIKE